MARFLFAVLPTRGHMYPSLPIAYALRAAGHEVAFATLPEFSPFLEAAGIAYFPISEDEATMTVRRRRRTEGDDRTAIKDAFRASFIAPLPDTIALLRRSTADWNPTVLVNDYVSFAPLIVGELEDRPVATLTMTVFSWPGARFGPFGRGLPPLPEGADDATRYRYAALRAQAESYFSDIVADLNEVRSSFGLPPRPGPLPVATLSPYLQMVQTVPALDYNRDDLPPQVHYVGPCAWDPPAAGDEETAAWLHALPAGRPLAVVAASGAFTRSAALVEAALDVLPEDGFAVLATLPFDHPLHDTAPSNPYVRLVRFTPHSQVLPHANLVITHGGFGMATKALLHGVPLIVVPFAGDQPEVAQRISAAGAGVRLDPGTLTARALRAAVQTVTGDPRFSDNARRLADLMAARSGPKEAAALLIRLARTGQPVMRNTATASAKQADILPVSPNYPGLLEEARDAEAAARPDRGEWPLHIGVHPPKNSSGESGGGGSLSGRYFPAQGGAEGTSLRKNTSLPPSRGKGGRGMGEKPTPERGGGGATPEETPLLPPLHRDGEGFRG